MLVHLLMSYSVRKPIFNHINHVLKQVVPVASSQSRAILPKRVPYFCSKLCRTYLSVVSRNLNVHSRTTKFFTGSAILFGVKQWSSSRIYCQKDDSFLFGSRDESEVLPKINLSLELEYFLNVVWDNIQLLSFALINALLAAYLNILIPKYLGGLVDVLTKFTADNTFSYLTEIRWPAWQMINCYVLQALCTFSYIWSLSCFGENMAFQLRKDLFCSLIHQDIAFYDGSQLGGLVHRLTVDVQDFKSSFKMVVSQGVRSLVQIIGSVVSLYYINSHMTVLLVITVPTIIYAGSQFGSNLRNLSLGAQEQLALCTAAAEEALGNIRTVRAFSMEDVEMENHTRLASKSKQLTTRLGLGIAIFQGLTNLALNGLVLGTLFMGGSLLSVNQLSAGELMAFLVATQMIQKSLAQMSMLYANVLKGMSAGKRVIEFIHLEPGMPLRGGESIPDDQIRGKVDFVGVAFTYPTRPEQKVLEKFSLSIPAGKVVALVGPSGAGKSTIAALLERFYNVNEGKITLDDRDITSLNPTWLRRNVLGFISQEPVLFSSSIFNNIRYANPDCSEEEVYRAAKLANAHDFIMKFPHGYQTQVGDRGVTLSGGQKQRVAIARALVKNPPVLILDEATSALDSESERIVQEALDNAAKDRTVLVIAHRLSTIRHADVIAVIDNGRILEIGNHESLMERRGLYWEMICQQHEKQRRRLLDKTG